MNSNTLNPHHRLQLALIIIAFVVVLVASALIYNYQMGKHITTTKEPPVTKESMERTYGTPVPLTEQDKKKIESIYGN
ncbi:MAG: hypothetical protein RLY57_311 [Candidatus Parcubacteria bacterium]